MKRTPHTVQTRLADFEEENVTPKSKRSLIDSPRREKRPPAKLWRKTIMGGEAWGVFDVDDTVLFVQILDGKIHAHGREAVCKYCGGSLEIRGDQVFCGGECGVFQGDFSYDLDSYLKWDGAKSLTLRKMVADEEGLILEERDLEPIPDLPEWSLLYEFEDPETDNED
jgi:hypothetical protein